jgi:hypothetical protein
MRTLSVCQRKIRRGVFLLVCLLLTIAGDGAARADQVFVDRGGRYVAHYAPGLGAMRQVGRGIWVLLQVDRSSMRADLIAYYESENCSGDMMLPALGVYDTWSYPSYIIPHSPDDTLISGRLSTIKVYISVV